MYVVRRPESPRLRPFVEHLGYYELRGLSGLERAVPSASAQLLINLERDAVSCYDHAGRPTGRLSGSIVQGTSSTPTVIDRADQRSVLCVAFGAGGAAPFFADSSAAYADRLVDLADLWGPDAALLRERLLAAPGPRAMLRLVEDALLNHLDDETRPRPEVRYAAALLDRGATTVADTADRVGLSPRTLSNRFTDTIGLRPKRFARVRRMQRVLRSLPGSSPGSLPAVDWASVAVEHGFYDQAHLINEFRELTGLTPTTYRGRGPGEHNHVPLEPRSA